MIEKNISLLMDIGSSDIRYYLYDLDEVPTFSEYLKTPLNIQPNQYMPIDDVSSILDILNTSYKDTDTIIFKMPDESSWIHGNMVAHEYSNCSKRPTSLTSKVRQDTTYASIEMALHRYLLGKQAVENISEYNLNINLYLVLPPIVLEADKDEFLKRIKCLTRLKSAYPYTYDVSVCFSNVVLRAEGSVALSYALFSIFEDDESFYIDLKDTAKPYLNSVIQLTDFGSTTTDRMLFRNMKMIETSKDTYSRGFNAVNTLYSKELHKKYGLQLSMPEIMRSLETCQIMISNKLENVEDCLNTAKTIFAEQYAANNQQYLEGCGVELRTLTAILPIGGGALPVIRDGDVVSPSLSSLIVKATSNYIGADIQVLPIDDTDPRLINILGLRMFFWQINGIVQ